MVAPAAQATSILPPNAQIPFINPQNGLLTNPALQVLQQIQTLINGLTPPIGCTATFASNKYTLTPLSIAPNVPSYLFSQAFMFVAPASSTGLVTATVVPAKGVLATLKVFKTNGSAQATAGDITINLFYLLYYVDSLDSGNGGFVLK